jgi:hypothetical protein
LVAKVVTTVDKATVAFRRLLPYTATVSALDTELEKAAWSSAVAGRY